MPSVWASLSSHRTGIENSLGRRRPGDLSPREQKAGLEGDKMYYLGDNAEQMRGSDDIDLTIQPPPISRSKSKSVIRPTTRWRPGAGWVCPKSGDFEPKTWPVHVLESRATTDLSTPPSEASVFHAWTHPTSWIR